jgi:hypothetical protein
MIRKNYTANTAARWDRYFKRVPFGLARNGAHDREAGPSIIAARRKNDCGPLASLFAAHPRREVYPNQIAGIRHILARYHNSLPTGSPQSVSEWRFSGVIRDTNSSRVGLRFGFRILTRPGPSTSSSKSSPILSFAAVATGFGIRTAKLFPHLASCVFMGPRVYTEYILLDAARKG